MARFVTVAALIAILTACAHKPSVPWDNSPEFNNCWSWFPPGPDFKKQMEEYAGTNDPNVVETGCIPLYRLDKEGCQNFQKGGAGDWPKAVVDWCSEYFDVTLHSDKKGAAGLRFDHGEILTIDSLRQLCRMQSGKYKL